MPDNARAVYLAPDTVVDLSSHLNFAAGESYAFYVSAGLEVIYTEELLTNPTPTTDHDAIVSVQEKRWSAILQVRNTTRFFAWAARGAANITVVRVA